VSSTPIALEDPFEHFDNSLAGDVRNPYPELAQTRRTEPVQRVGDGSGDTPAMFVVYRHDDVAHVLGDGATFSSTVLTEVMGPVMGDRIILGMDEPEHRRHRALVSTAFTQKVLARWEVELVRQVVDELIDGFADRGRAELVREYTFRFPAQVIAGVLGLPREDFPQFQVWTSAIISAHAAWDRGLEASAALKAYLADALTERRRAPRDDLISDLAVAELDGERLDDEEIFSFLRLLLPAGAETTFRSSGNFIFALLTHIEQLDALRADRSLMQQAIEEALRWEPPLLITSRICARDTEIRGMPIPAGAHVTVMLGAANRDENRYPDPDRFDIFRDPKQHISFGHGPHTCLGMHLARMETRVAVGALLDRLPNLRLEPGNDDPHIHGQIFRSPTSLPVRFD
jgi:cytochrome P450